MADVTISSLPVGTPSSSALLPYSQGGQTLMTSIQGMTAAGSFLPVFSNSTKPGSAVVGQIIFNTDEGIVQVWNGVGWQNVNTQSGIYPTIEAAQADGVIMYFPMANISQSTSIIGGANFTIQTSSNNIQNATGIDGGAILRGELNVTDFIRINSVPVNNIANNNWTVSFWFYKTSTSIYAATDGVGIIWPYYGTDTVNFGGFSTVAGSNPMWGYAGNNAETLYGYKWPQSSVNSSYIVMNGFIITTWYHLVVTHSNNSLKHYVNGNLMMTKTDNPTINNNWSIGNYYYVQNGNSNNHYGKGRVDEIVLFNKELNNTQVQDLYNKQLAGRALITGTTY